MMTNCLNCNESCLNFKQNRNYGIDTLRVISAIMIVMLHVFSQGGILSVCDELTFSGEFMWFIQIGSLGFVNVFALISGYVGITSKHRISNILNLWLQVFLYTLISKVLVLMFFEKTFSLIDFCKTFFPVTNSENWYFSAYFVLFFLIPILNYMIENIEVAIIKRCLLACAFLFMIIESISSVDVFGVRTGYSALWLMIMYVIGAYLKKYNPLKRLLGWQCLIGVAVCMLLTLFSKILIEFITLRCFGAPAYGTKFLIYTSPIMVMQSVFIVQIFSRLNIHPKIQKLVSWFAPMTFGVFVIHTTDVFYRYMLRDAFLFVADYSLIGMLGVAILSTLGIWLCCSLIDFIRIYLFKLFRINKLTNYCGLKIKCAVDKIVNI